MSGFDSVSIYTKLITAGTSACIADAVTFPLDTAKVRLQVRYQYFFIQSALKLSLQTYKIFRLIEKFLINMHSKI